MKIKVIYCRMKFSFVENGGICC